MMHEVAMAQFVFDELIGGVAVRYPEQGFREHHQCQALLGGKCKLAEHVFDAAEPTIARAYNLDQPRSSAVDPRVLFGAELTGLEQPRRHDSIIGRIGCVKRRQR
jgi:hypothetical protein